MAFGDILSGLAEAGHEHRKTLLQMDYQNKTAMAERYGKISEDKSYPEDVRAEALKRAITIHTIEPGKKLPKEFESFTFTIEPKSVPGVPAHTEHPEGSGPLGIAAPEIPPGVMPAQTVPIAPMSFAETLSRAGQTARQASQIKTETEIEEIKQRHAFLKQQFPGLPETAIAAMATGHAAPNLSFSLPGTMDAAQVKTVTGLDVAPGHYNVRMFNGEYLATPVEAKSSGGLKFAQNDKNEWVGYTTDTYGNVTIQSNLGLTPPQGVPTDSTLYGVKIMPNSKGGYSEVPYTQTTQRVRSGTTAGRSSFTTAPAPTPPPTQQPTAQFGDPALIENIRQSLERSTPGPLNMELTPPAAMNAAYPGQVAAPAPPPTAAMPTLAPAPTAPPTRTTPRASVGTAREIPGVGKSLTPNQIQNNLSGGAAFDQLISRLSNVLQNADKFSSLYTRAKMRLAADPQHEGRLTIVGAAAPLTKEEADFAGDYLSLGEDINLLRGPFNAAGFRGTEARATQQAQAGLISGDFNLFKKTVFNTLQASIEQMAAINKAMTNAGQPLQVSDGVLRTYLLLNNSNENKALEALKRDGWQVE